MSDQSTDAPGRPLHRRDRALVAIVPVILVLIAALSIHRFHDQRQSSWQGIGFGMFATYDNSVSRFLRVTIEVDGEETLVNARSEFSDLVERSRAVPLGPDPVELAESVRSHTSADRVVVEVWGIDVDAGSTLEISIDPIRRVEVP